MPISYPSGDVEQSVGYMSLKFKEKVWARDINLSIVIIEMPFTAMKLDDIIGQ